MADTTSDAAMGEMEALSSIYGNDYTSTSPSSFRLRVVPNPAYSTSTATTTTTTTKGPQPVDKYGNHAVVIMAVQYPRDYPNDPPTVSIEKVRGLTPRQFAELEGLVAQQLEGLKGREAVLELAQFVEDFLLAHNVKPGSLHDQMIAEQHHRTTPSPSSSLSLSQSKVHAASATSDDASQTRDGATNQETTGRDGDEERDTRRTRGTRDGGRTAEDAMYDIVQRDMDRRMLKASSGSLFDLGSIDDGSVCERDEFYSPQPNRQLASSMPQKIMSLPLPPSPTSQPLSQSPTSSTRSKAETSPSPVVSALMPAAVQGYHGIKPLKTRPYGAVFRAVSDTSGEDVVIKSFSISVMAKSESSSCESAPSKTDTFDALCELENYIRATSELEHDNIVPYKDIICDTDSDVVYIVEEAVGFSSLRDHVSKGKSFSESEIARFTVDVLRGLVFLNEQQLFHGDLRTSKMLLNEDDQVMLCDYGILDLLYAISSVRKEVPSFDERMKEDVYSLGLALKELFGKSSGSMSMSAKEFIAACLTSDARSRPSPAALLAYPFVSAMSVSAASRSVAPLSSSIDAIPTPIPSIIPAASRYKSDFEETEFIGHGAFGEVVKARNKLDKRYYAVKKIPFNAGNISSSEKLLREVRTLSTLNHEHVVRYYQAWTEDINPDEERRLRKNASTIGDESEGEDDEEDEEDEEEEDKDEEDESSDTSEILGLNAPTEAAFTNDDWMTPSASLVGVAPSAAVEVVFQGAGVDDTCQHETNGVMTPTATRKTATPTRAESPSVGRRTDKQQKKPRVPKMLYIQMEFCPKLTLRTVIDERTHMDDEDVVWKMLRQISEGLNHIHAQGIIHRDLKPANIFIDENDQIKIGDFGLSTVVADSKRIVGNVHDIDRNSSLTSQIGTPIYTSPEVLDKSVKHYNQKVDIYSLGIIFFEMCCPFGTRMESAMAIRDLRERRQFPPGFEERKPQEAKVIAWLVQPKPEDRPTALELLRSPYVPVKLEEELLKSAVTEISRPSTTIFAFLMEKLFQNAADPHLSRLLQPPMVPTSRSLVSRDLVVERLEAVFRRHAATRIETPLLEPKVAGRRVENSLSVVDENGAVYTLRYDAVESFARIAYQIPIAAGMSLKRYDFPAVYRRKQGEIHETTLAKFDIVAPLVARTACDAEVVRVMSEALTELFPQERYYIRINHVKVVRAIFDVCQIPKEIARHVLNVLGSESGRNTWKQQLKHAGVPEEYLRRLGRYVLLSGVVLEQALQLPEFSSDSKQEGSIAASKLGLEAIRELCVLGKNLHVLDIRSEVILDPWFTLGQHYEGLVFQAVLNAQGTQPRESVMAGGRYDALLFRTLAEAGASAGSTPRLTNGAVGVSVSVETIANRVADESRAKALMRSSRGKGASLVEADIVSKTAPCDVLVAGKSDMRNLEPEKLRIAGILWSKRIRADVLHEELSTSTARKLLAYCEEAKITWLALIREKSYVADRLVRLWNFRTKEHGDVHETAVASVVQRGYLGDAATVAATDGSSVAQASAATQDSEAQSSQMMAGNAGSSQVLSLSGESAKATAMFDVCVLHTDSPEWRRKIAEKCVIHLKRAFGQYLSSTARLKVVAVDIPIAYVREMNAAPQMLDKLTTIGGGGGGGKSSDGEKRQLQQMRERAAKLVEYLRSAEIARLPLVVVFSVADDDFEVISVTAFTRQRKK